MNINVCCLVLSSQLNLRSRCFGVNFAESKCVNEYIKRIYKVFYRKTRLIVAYADAIRPLFPLRPFSGRQSPKHERKNADINSVVSSNRQL